MTIKEIEERSGMTRANIRFYESEGLISPVRSENRYRDYTENDLEILKRIKLLRTLHISLEEIKQLHNGEQELAEALDRHLRTLEEEKKDIEKSTEVCRVMRNDRVRYNTLNAQHYLDRIQHDEEIPVPEFKMDVAPGEGAPWKRLFARLLDEMIYYVLWDMFLIFVFDVNLVNMSNIQRIISMVFSCVLMLFIEPAMLALFGTTIAKAAFGIYVYDNNGRKLTYSSALTRTKQVFWYGMGVFIPVYQLYRMWKSFQICLTGEVQEWEYDSELVIKKIKPYRVAVYAGIWIILFISVFFAVGFSGMPKNRGDITVEEFCENYRRYNEYYGFNNIYQLNTDGSWTKEPVQSGVYEINLSSGIRPEITFTEENGLLKSIRMEMNIYNCRDWVDWPIDEMCLSILSFMRAQDTYGIFSDEADDIIEYIDENTFTDYSFTAHGITISCEVDYNGFDNASYILIPKDEKSDNEYHLIFSMSR